MLSLSFAVIFMFYVTDTFSSAWIRGGAAGACATPEFSDSSTEHSNVPPPGIMMITLKLPVISKSAPLELETLSRRCTDMNCSLEIKPLCNIGELPANAACVSHANGTAHCNDTSGSTPWAQNTLYKRIINF